MKELAPSARAFTIYNRNKVPTILRNRYDVARIELCPKPFFDIVYIIRPTYVKWYVAAAVDGPICSK